MMTLAVLSIVFAVALAVVNGGNDNLKGLATLIGSGVVDYRRALWIASIATAAGSVASIALAGELVAAFGGRGLVPDATARSAEFLAAVSGAAALTVGLATRIGMPISTTHALVGGLAGAGFALAPQSLQLGVLGNSFFLPLLVAPVLAIVTTLALAPLARRWMQRAAQTPEACACLVDDTDPVHAALAIRTATRFARLDDPQCAAPTATRIATLSMSRVLDGLHYASAAAVSFARGLNDTPKMAAILVASGAAGLPSALTVAIAMTIGGILTARRVTQTMALRITSIGPGEGLGANLATAALVIGASRLGVPVSTTHVSCGALFGIAASSGRAQWSTIAGILLAWLITLPVAAISGWMLARLFTT